MFIPPAYLVSSAYVLISQTAQTDAQRLTKLHEAISKLTMGKHAYGKSSENITSVQFEKLYPIGNIQKWETLRTRIASSTAGYNDLTFLLCYYKRDYARNVYNLLRQYRLWQMMLDPNSPANARVSLRHNHHLPYTIEAVEATSGYLQLLYLKHHDTLSLGSLLDLRLDGALAEEQSDFIGELWDMDAVPLLVSAYRSAVRTDNLAGALWMKDKGAKQEAYRELKRLSHNPDPRIAASAKKVEQELRKLPAD